MNKSYIKYFYAVVVLLMLGACKKNNVVVDQDALIPPEAARFMSNASSDVFWVANGPGGGNVYKIPIGVTTVSSSDRVIQLAYTSSTGAVKGTHYNAPATLTIPAGKTVDTLIIQGLFAGYTPTTPQNLKITITSGAVKANAYNNTFTLTLRVPCPVVLANLAGAFDNTNEYDAGAFSYGPYTTALTGVTVINATSAKGKLSNLYDAGWADVEAIFEYSSAIPTNWTVSIVKQPTGRNSGGFPYFVRTSPGQVSTFNSCDNSISITIDLLGGSSGNTVLLSNYQLVLEK